MAQVINGLQVFKANSIAEAIDTAHKIARNAAKGEVLVVQDKQIVVRFNVCH